MKPYIALICIVFFLLACSEEQLLSTHQQEQDTLVNYQYESDGLFGHYKGIFTTVDSKYRAIVDLVIPPPENAIGTTSSPIAVLQTSNETVITAKGPKLYEASSLDQGMLFEADEISFIVKRSEESNSLVVERAIFKGLSSDIILAKHSQQAPVTPIMGTYSCTDCGNHPRLGIGLAQTFNMMFTTADGDGAITTQTALGSRVNSGIGYQNNCVAGGGIYSHCDVNSGDGSTTTIGYIANGNPVYWSGTHAFDNQASGANDCSSLFGTWQWMSNGYGLMTGTFESDSNCFQNLYLEDFETFDGSGFSPTPVAGQLDSDIVIATGLSDGSMLYGDTQTSGDFARGTSSYAFGVTTGGIYSFNQASTFGNALGVQPTASDFTPGTFEFRVTNNTGSALSILRLSYGVLALNDEDGSSSMNFSYSTDGTNFIPAPALEFISPELAPMGGGSPPPPPELPVVTRRILFVKTPVSSGGFIYLRFTADDVVVSGSRDQLMIDDVRVDGM